MKKQITKEIKNGVRDAGILLFFCFLLFFLFAAIHSLEAPFLLVTAPKQLGEKLGTISMTLNGNTRTCWVYTSKQYNYTHTVPCLMIYPKFRLNPFPFGHALKITENSIGIFNDAPTECLPMGKYVYESVMTLPVYSVDDDMKGWDAKYSIIKEKSVFRYRIHSARNSKREIEFTIPFSFFESLKLKK